MGRRTASSSGAVGGGDDAGLSSCERRSQRLQSSERRCARPTCPLLYSSQFKIRLVFPVETSPTQQNITALETPAHEFTTLQPADATLAVSSITGKEPQVVTDRAGM